MKNDNYSEVNCSKMVLCLTLIYLWNGVSKNFILSDKWWSTTWITGNNFNDKLYPMESDEKIDALVISEIPVKVIKKWYKIELLHLGSNCLYA